MKFILYTASWCYPCRQLKQWLPNWLAARGHSLEVIDIESTTASESITSVPTLVFDGRKLTGTITPHRILEALE